MQCGASYQSRHELVSIVTHDGNSYCNTSELVSKFQQHIRHSEVPKTYIACFQGNTICIYDLSTDTVHTIPNISLGKGIAFLNQHQLVVQCGNVLNVWDMKLAKFVKSHKIDMDECYRLVTMCGRLVIIQGEMYRVGLWNTETDSYRTLIYSITNDIQPISKDKFVTCHSHGLIRVWSIDTLTTVQSIKLVEHTWGFSCDYWKNEYLVVGSRKGIQILDLISENVVDTMLQVSISYIRVIGELAIVVYDDQEISYCNICNLMTRELVVEKLFKATAFVPFVVKGTLLIYYEEDCISVFDVSVMKKVREIQGKFVTGVDLTVW